MLLSAEHLSINFGSRQLLDDVNFYLNEVDKVVVIGTNGTGKFSPASRSRTAAPSPGTPTSRSVCCLRTRQWRNPPRCWSRSSSTSPPSSGS